MGLLFRKCTSFRIRGTDLIQKGPYSYSQRITNGLYFGNTLTALTPIKRNTDVAETLASKTLRGQQYRNALWRIGREFRGSRSAMTWTTMNGHQQAVANALFWGVPIYDFTLGIYVQPIPGSILVSTTAITAFLILVLTPPVATVLLNPEDLVLLDMLLSISRPRDFMPPTGGGGQFGYGG
jgi:hypothetical protein